MAVLKHGRVKKSEAQAAAGQNTVIDRAARSGGGRKNFASVVLWTVNTKVFIRERLTIRKTVGAKIPTNTELLTGLHAAL